MYSGDMSSIQITYTFYLFPGKIEGIEKAMIEFTVVPFFILLVFSLQSKEALEKEATRGYQFT